jgi:hypothetical protein
LLPRGHVRSKTAGYRISTEKSRGDQKRNPRGCREIGKQCLGTGKNKCSSDPKRAKKLSTIGKGRR